MGTKDMTDAELSKLISVWGNLVLLSRQTLYGLCEEAKRRRGRPPEVVGE